MYFVLLDLEKISSTAEVFIFLVTHVYVVLPCDVTLDFISRDLLYFFFMFFPLKSHISSYIILLDQQK